LAREVPLAGLEYHEELTSTSDRALALARGEAVIASGGSLVTPLLVIAERQTAGRGRGANRWWSSDGALTFSLIVGEEAGEIIESANSPRLSLAVAESVRAGLDELIPGSEVSVKPPNDVLIGGRKACGVLIETPAVSPRRCVIGIGLNVNNSLQEAPPEIAERAIALVDVKGEQLDRTTVLITILRRLLESLRAA
jgi:BirA family biotin operon repressor/biotin-[acetyl-CoA-carboxylase] ligase